MTIARQQVLLVGDAEVGQAISAEDVFFGGQVVFARFDLVHDVIALAQFAHGEAGTTDVADVIADTNG